MDPDKADVRFEVAGEDFSYWKFTAPHISGDVEQQIAYRILVIAVPHPDLLLIEPAHALPDTGKQLLELTNRIIHEDAFNGWLHKASVKRTRRRQGERVSRCASHANCMETPYRIPGMRRKHAGTLWKAYRSKALRPTSSPAPT